MIRLSLALVALASPALALETPAATTSDPRVRTVFYRPSEPVELVAAVGATLEIQLDPGEVVIGVPTSDQSLLEGGTVSDRVQPNPASSQDGNVAVAVVGSDILVKPLKPLSAQPMFIISRKGDQVRHYTFELLTRGGAQTVQASTSYWVVHFVYPAEPATQRSVAELTKLQQEALARQIQAPVIHNNNYTIRGQIP